uniref:Uncharacterized protein n=1 Tax=Romanomermis culicivorax TaxID=13658 RepID=A0A915JKZ3_ROMCU
MSIRINQKFDRSSRIIARRPGQSACLFTHLATIYPSSKIGTNVKVSKFSDALHQNSDKDQKFRHQKVIETFLMKMPIFYQISICDDAHEFTTVQQLATAVSETPLTHSSGAGEKAAPSLVRRSFGRKLTAGSMEETTGTMTIGRQFDNGDDENLDQNGDDKLFDNNNDYDCEFHEKYSDENY